MTLSAPSFAFFDLPWGQLLVNGLALGSRKAKKECKKVPLAVLLCPQCDAIYHLTAKPPRRMGLCDNDGSVLIVREDDQPSTVRRRLQIYHRITNPVLGFYQSRGLLRRVQGLGLPSEVSERLRVALGDL